MKNTYVIVLTGGMASGKSTVASYIKERGYELVDSDELVHKVYADDEIMKENLCMEFGKEILIEGKIDRIRLSEIILKDNEKLNRLNVLVHTRITELLIKAVENTDKKVLFLDIPLLFEAKEFLESQGLKYDEIWFVYITEKQQIERLKQRASKEGKDVTAALTILGKQMSNDYKKKYADKIIDNTGDLGNTYKNVEKLLAQID